MKIAALYDIHGNLPALEVVLAEVEASGVDLIVVGGDVLPGPMPAECLELLNGTTPPVRYIHGNGEVDTLAIGADEDVPRVPVAFHDTLRWCAGQLDEASRRTMAGWPRTIEIDLDALGRVLFCHATPDDENAIFTRRTPELRLRELFSGCTADVVLTGHTHMPFERTVGELHIVNPGSVGMPFGASGAHWAVVSSDGIEHRHTDYDRAAAMERFGRTGYPGLGSFDLLNPPDEDRMIAVFEGTGA